MLASLFPTRWEQALTRWVTLSILVHKKVLLLRVSFRGYISLSFSNTFRSITFELCGGTEMTHMRRTSVSHRSPLVSRACVVLLCVAAFALSSTVGFAQ